MTVLFNELFFKQDSLSLFSADDTNHPGLPQQVGKVI
jgi:hypothetical protein